MRKAEVRERRKHLKWIRNQTKVHAEHMHRQPNPPIGRNWKLALLEPERILNGVVTELKQSWGTVMEM